MQFCHLLANVHRGILNFIADNGKTTSMQLANYMGLSQRRARELLNALVSEGLVVKVGNYRHAKYILKNKKTVDDVLYLVEK